MVDFHCRGVGSGQVPEIAEPNPKTWNFPWCCPQCCGAALVFQCGFGSSRLGLIGSGFGSSSGSSVLMIKNCKNRPSLGPIIFRLTRVSLRSPLTGMWQGRPDEAEEKHLCRAVLPPPPHHHAQHCGRSSGPGHQRHAPLQAVQQQVRTGRGLPGTRRCRLP
jgi:hypothetical protein